MFRPGESAPLKMKIDEDEDYFDRNIQTCLKFYYTNIRKYLVIEKQMRRQFLFYPTCHSICQFQSFKSFDNHFETFYTFFQRRT